MRSIKVLQDPQVNGKKKRKNGGGGAYSRRIRNLASMQENRLHLIPSLFPRRRKKRRRNEKDEKRRRLKVCERAKVSGRQEARGRGQQGGG